METVTPILKPDQAAMHDHLAMLFKRALTGRVEITAIRVDRDGERTPPRTRFFDVDELEEAAEYAASVNAEHLWNVYVGAAARIPDVFPGKAATDEDFHRVWAIHADVDDDHDLEAVRGKYRALGITPPIVVVTGRTPTTRAQLWWPLIDPITDADVYRRTLRAVASVLHTDPAVTAAKQLMRLAGGVNWPKKDGRVLEKTEVIHPSQAQQAFSLEQLHRAFPLDAPPQAQEHADERPGTLLGALAARDLRSALASMRADDRDLWVRMGHALKELGEQGRGLWIEWSQTSDKYDPADAARVWDSLHPSRTGYQAVFAEAQRQGWVNPGKGVDGNSRPPAEPKVDPETGEVLEEPEPADRPFRASELMGEPPARQWVVQDWIIEGAVNSLYGDGGTGKTLLAQQLACSVSTGAPWLGIPTKRGSVLAVLCEDERDELWRRHNDIKAAMGYPVGNPFEDVWLWPRVGEDNVIVRWDRDGKATLGPLYERVVAMVEELEPSLLILDTLADVYGGNEIDRPQVNYFVKTVLGGLIKRMAERGVILTILLLGHPSVAGKASGAGYSGSTAWNNAVRSRMYLAKPESTADAPAPADERILTRGKANYASSGDDTALRLFFSDGVLHATEDAEDGDSILWAAKRDIIQLVDRAWKTGAPYSAQKGHRRFIYSAVVDEMRKGGFDPVVTRQAVRECIDDGQIYPSKDKAQRGYRSAENVR